MDNDKKMAATFLVGCVLMEPAARLIAATDCSRESLVKSLHIPEDEATQLVNEVLDDIYKAKRESEKMIAEYIAQGKTKEDLVRDIEKDYASRGMPIEAIREIYEDINGKSGGNND